MKEYIEFLTKLPYLQSTSVPIILFLLSVINIIILSTFFAIEYKEVSIYVLIFLTVIFGVYTVYTGIPRLDPPVVVPEYDYATPTDIMNSLREDDKNSLMFGRSNQPTDVMSDNVEPGILRGYANSSTLGEQYGTFTGITLYDGPEMFEQSELTRVFGYDDIDEIKQETPV